MAAGGAHRRARRAPLHPDRLRDDGHDAARTRARSSAFLPEVRPTWFFAVPRIWEKLKAGLEAMLAAQPRERERDRGALDAARRKVELEQAGEPVPDELAATVAEADAELFAGLRAMLGLDEVVAVNVGAAPTPREVLVFFHAIGIPLAELWGMSETCGAGTCNPPGRGQDRHRRPAGARASRSSSPRTASCSCAATS